MFSLGTPSKFKNKIETKKSRGTKVKKERKLKVGKRRRRSMCFKPSLSSGFRLLFVMWIFAVNCVWDPIMTFRIPAMVVIHRTRSARLFTRSFRENSKSIFMDVVFVGLLLGPPQLELFNADQGPSFTHSSLETTESNTSSICLVEDSFRIHFMGTLGIIKS